MTASYQYIDQVRRALLCSPTHRDKFVQNLEPLVEDFTAEHPNAVLADLRRDFGEPEELAQQYMSTLEDGEVEKYKQRRKWRHRACLAAVAVIVIVMAIGLVAKYTRVFEPPITAETVLVVTEDAKSLEEAKEILRELGIGN